MIKEKIIAFVLMRMKSHECDCTDSEIAFYVGSTREWVNKSIHSLVEDGIIAIKKNGRRRIIHIDMNSSKSSIVNRKEEVGIDVRKQEFIDRVSIDGNSYRQEMIDEFVAYWTETSKSGKRMRFEAEKFFDVKRRLTTWAKNATRKATVDVVSIPQGNRKEGW
jgi:hypothetical protein